MLSQHPPAFIFSPSKHFIYLCGNFFSAKLKKAQKNHWCKGTWRRKRILMCSKLDRKYWHHLKLDLTFLKVLILRKRFLYSQQKESQWFSSSFNDQMYKRVKQCTFLQALPTPLCAIIIFYPFLLCSLFVQLGFRLFLPWLQPTSPWAPCLEAQFSSLDL